MKFKFSTFIIPLTVFNLIEAQEQEDVFVAPDVNVISVSPIQGSGVSSDRLPSNIQSVDLNDLDENKNFSVTETLNKKTAGISISNLNGSPMQNDINFRGYVAGPMLGSAQAMAVYQNGMRINEAFGEIIQWDLVPEFAINSMQVFPGGDPVFGQNAIGGAISMEMKNGFDFNKSSVQVAGGSFKRTNEVIEYGISDDNFAVYLGGNFNYDKGYRDHSESYLENIFTDFRYRNENTEVFLNLGQAYTDLNGNGAVPLTLMDLEGRDAVYTYPDNTHNKNYYLMLGANHFVNENLSLQGNLYFRHMERRNYNGDEFEGKDCGVEFDNTTPGNANGTLCGEYESNAAADGVAILDVSGAGINYTQFGLALDSSENEVESIGAINRSNTKSNAFGFGLQSTNESIFDDKPNTFISGMTYDYSYNSFGSSTELAIIQGDRGVQGTGLMLGTDAEGEQQFITNLEAETHNLGIYGSNIIDLDESTSLNLSARYNWAGLRMADQHGSALEGHHFFWSFNPGIGITKKIDSTVFFASYKESSRNPSIAELSCADPNAPCRLPNSFQADPPLDQVKNRNFEIGARGNKSFNYFDSKQNVDWTLNAFAGRNYSDIIFIGGNRAGTGYFRNVGNTQRLGAEFALNGRIGKKWNWFAKYAYVRATFETSQKISSVGHPTNSYDDDDFDDNELRENFQIPIKPGSVIPGISPHIGRVGVSYNFDKNWNMALDVEANSAQFYRGDESNTAGQKVPGHFLVNMSTEYTIKNNHIFEKELNLFLRARNIFDENYETGGLYAENEVSGTGGSGTFVTPGQPFTILAGVDINF